MGGPGGLRGRAGATVAPVVFLAAFFSASGVTVAGAATGSTPFFTGEAPLAPLARAFGFETSGDLRSGRVRLSSAEHEIVLAPGIARARIDGRGVPLLTSPRFVDGRLVVPAELADIIRNVGGPARSSGVPASSRRAPRRKPKTAFLPPATDCARLLLAGGAGTEDDGRGDAAASVGSGPRRAGASSKKPKKKAGRPSGPGNEGERPRHGTEKVKGFVLIDPGHGGRDEGARGRRGTKEKDVVLRIAKALASELRRHGVRAELTRTDDTFVSLPSRAATANRLKPDLLLSLHVNGYRGSSISGVETWVVPTRLTASKWTAAKSRSLARKVLAAVVEATGERDRGVRAGPFTVLRRAKVPAVLVEVGFISNLETEKKLVNAAYRRKIARAIARAVIGSGLLKERAPASGRGRGRARSGGRRQ